ncbi:AAA family ATPase [Sorangium sp. So ce118]
MRIASFWAKGYRSLRDVRVDDLGAFNVFYGPNGSGKSNLLEGLRALFELVTVIAATEILEVTSVPWPARWRAASSPALRACSGPPHRRDRPAGAPPRAQSRGP